MEKTELDNLFGEVNTDTSKITNSVEHKMFLIHSDQLPDQNMDMSLPEEVLKNYKDAKWRTEQAKLRKEELYKSANYSIPSKNRQEAKQSLGYSLFTPDKVFLERFGDNTNNSDPNVRGIYRSMINSRSAKDKALITTETIKGFQKSIDSILTSNKVFRSHETHRFIKWLQMNNVDFKKLSEEQYKAYYIKFNKEKKIRLDVLIENLIDFIKGIFSTQIINDTTLTDEQVDDILGNEDKKENILANYTRDNGPILSEDSFDMLDWYFSKYGLTPEDRKYFEEGAVDRHNKPMTQLFETFKMLSGYDFLELYAKYYRKWKAVYNRNAIESFETTEVTDDGVEEVEIVYDEIEEIE